MDYEKKYKEAVGILEFLIGLETVQESGTIPVKDIINTFPELKSHNDERIRKSLISVFTTHKKEEMYYGTSVDEILEWLDRQCEQKPTDKAEPKFHEGEWVVTDKNNVVQIKAIEDSKYVLENTMRFSVDYVDKCWRKWTIQDAKDGDVVEEELNRALQTKVEQKPDWSEEDERGLGDALWAIQQARTIAKDENDMGNLWYAENWLNSLKDRVQPQPKREWSEDDSVMIDNILGTYKTLEDMLDLTTCQDKDILESMNFERDWIKSLKYRIQPKQELREEKEKDLFNTAKYLREYAERCVQGEYSKMEIFSLADRIESICPQNRCGWNDMSVKPIYPCDILYQQPNGNMFIYRYIEGGRANDAQTPTFCNLDENGKWIYLKDVKPQNTWKPNDEHCELEEFAKIVRSNLTGISKAVQELFESKYLQLTGNKMYGGFKD